MGLFVYFRLQLQRMAKLLPGILFFLVFLGGTILIGGSYFLQKNKDENTTQKYRIGVVGEIDTPYISAGMSLIKNFDDSKYMFELIPMEEEEAKRSLYTGDINVYAVVPEGFENAINYGIDNLTLKFYASSSSGQKALTSIFMEGMSDIVSTCIVDSQAGIYGMIDIYSVYIGGYSQEEVDRIFMEYINMILDRGDFTEVENLGYSSGLDYYNYYFCTIFLFFAFLLSLSTISYFSGRKLEYLQVIKTRGIYEGLQIIAEFLAYFLFFVLMNLITLIAIGFFAKFGILQIALYDENPFIFAIFMLIRLIPVLLMIAAFQFMLYEILSGIISRIVSQFILCLGMSYFSGYFYPESFFPIVIQRIGSVLPTGIAFRYFKSLLLGNTLIIDGLFVLTYFVLFLLITFILRHKKLLDCVKD